MIPKDYITAWRVPAPWRQGAQVEQDLVISRAIVEMFCVEDIADRDDIVPLLRPDIDWDFEDAFRLVSERIIEELPGDPWKGVSG